MLALPRAQAVLKTMKIRTKKLKADGLTVRWFAFGFDYCGRIFQFLSSSATCFDCETKSLFMPFSEALFAGKHFHLKVTFLYMLNSFHVSLSYFNNLHEKSSHRRILVDTTRFANNIRLQILSYVTVAS